MQARAFGPARPESGQAEAAYRRCGYDRQRKNPTPAKISCKRSMNGRSGTSHSGLSSKIVTARAHFRLPPEPRVSALCLGPLRLYVPRASFRPRGPGGRGCRCGGASRLPQGRRGTGTRKVPCSDQLLPLPAKAEGREGFCHKPDRAEFLRQAGRVCRSH
jgi:hypothetical protein